VQPGITVALGVTAARQLLGKPVTIAAMRGRPIELAEGGLGWVTIHPSFLLRLPDRGRAEDAFAAFVEDLQGAARALAES
jgi:uracil-DNA glycosylase